MRAAISARVSTADKDQNPETQLLPLREFAAAQGWTVGGEFTDRAPATDLRARTAWRELLDQASRRRVDLVLVWRIDRAFRSVLDAATTLERLRTWGVGLRSYTEPWLDTTSPFGEALYYITAAYAQLERGILAERVRAGMERSTTSGPPPRPARRDRPRGIQRAVARDCPANFGRRNQPPPSRAAPGCESHHNRPSPCNREVSLLVSYRPGSHSSHPGAFQIS
jgi:DNA invertase Pin-like site-specific DNA recombinase